MKTNFETKRFLKKTGAVWNLTGDCTITSLVNHGMINFNGHTITLANGTVFERLTPCANDT